jgi:hypothetical protein
MAFRKADESLVSSDNTAFTEADESLACSHKT